ncbi:hypothetical protein ACGFIY_33525 [Micromonospora chersina]|uniref:hypothetical protein n=1 Tax=Micromonospora chersina TaxID=47854 RepID=UPI00370F9BD5
MKRTSHSRLTGAIGIGAGVLWLASWVLEVFVESGVGTTSWYAGQLCATLALLATTILMYGFARTRSGGNGRVARAFLALSWVGWLLLSSGGIAFIATGGEDIGAMGLVFPVGGNLASLGALVGGIIIAVRGELTGWQRYMPTVYGVLFSAAEYVQSSGAGGASLSFGVEFVKYAALLILAVGLRTATFREPDAPATSQPIRV